MGSWDVVQVDTLYKSPLVAGARVNTLYLVEQDDHWFRIVGPCLVSELVEMTRTHSDTGLFECILNIESHVILLLVVSRLVS